jgi:LPXTG-motif cell wall-anchored protein
MIAALAATLLAAVPASAASDCPSGTTQFKIDSRPSNGTYGDGTLSVTISNSDEDSFSWSSNITVDSVMVKAGTSLKENPGGRSGTASSATNPSNGKPYGISHVSFCYSTDSGGDNEPEEEDDCPEDGSGNGNGKGNMDECDEDNPTKDEDCPDKPGNGNGNMPEDCDDVESDREERCPDGSKDTNGDMPGGCLEDEDKLCPDGSVDSNGDMPGGCGEPDDKRICPDGSVDSNGTMPGGCGGDDTLGDVDRRPAQPRNDQDADVLGIRFRGNRGPATAPQVQGQQDAGAEALPRTGLPVLPFVLIGFGLISAGAFMRRRKKTS